MRTTALIPLLCLPLVGCLAGATATGSGGLILTEYGAFTVGTDATTYVQIGHSTAISMDLYEYSLGTPDRSRTNKRRPSTPLTGALAAGEFLVVEIAGGDFANVFGRAPSQQLATVEQFAYTPDAVYLYLADGSGFNGASQIDPSEWIETSVFFSDENEANNIASVFSMDCD
jgi:hypothetical protein